MHARISTMDRPGCVAVQSGACSRSSPAPPARPARRIIDRLTAADARPAPLARHRVRLGRPLDVAAGARRRGRRVHRLLPRPRAARRGGDRRRVRPRGAAPRASSGSVLLSGRGEPEALRAEREVAAAGVPTHRRALLLVRAELHRELHGRRRANAARSRCPPSDVPEPFVDAEDIADVAVRRADRGRPRRRGLRAHRAARAAHRRSRGGDRRRVRPRRCASRAITPEAYSEAAPPELAEFVVFLFTRAARRPQRAAPGRRAAARSAAPRATSASSPAAPRRGALGMSRHPREPGHRRALHVHRGHAGAARVRLRAARGRQGADPARPRHADRALRGRRGDGALPARAAVGARAARAT